MLKYHLKSSFSCICSVGRWREIYVDICKQDKLGLKYKWRRIHFKAIYVTIQLLWVALFSPVVHVLLLCVLSGTSENIELVKLMFEDVTVNPMLEFNLFYFLIMRMKYKFYFIVDNCCLLQGVLCSIVIGINICIYLQ